MDQEEYKRKLFLSPLAKGLISILALSHTFLMLRFINKIQLWFKCLVTCLVFFCSSAAIISFRSSSYSSQTIHVSIHLLFFILFIQENKHFSQCDWNCTFTHISSPQPHFKSYLLTYFQKPQSGRWEVKGWPTGLWYGWQAVIFLGSADEREQREHSVGIQVTVMFYVTTNRPHNREIKVKRFKDSGRHWHLIKMAKAKS